jgi:hypothetical protein
VPTATQMTTIVQNTAEDPTSAISALVTRVPEALIDEVITTPVMPRGANTILSTAVNMMMSVENDNPSMPPMQVNTVERTPRVDMKNAAST